MTQQELLSLLHDMSLEEKVYQMVQIPGALFRIPASDQLQRIPAGAAEGTG